ncbi:MAG: hypothetical protein K1Y36_25910 [Blastocatellia bacterium]|nr:hypothetical protein [Blastocatellia bacterium]
MKKVFAILGLMVGMLVCILAIVLYQQGGTPIPVQYDNMCSQSYDGKLVTVEGYLEVGSSVMVNKSRNGTTYNIEFKKTPADTKYVSAEVEQGRWWNCMEGLAKSYKPEDIKFHTNDGTVLTPKDRMRITARVRSTTQGGTREVCYIKVTKIEKA